MCFFGGLYHDKGHKTANVTVTSTATAATGYFYVYLSTNTSTYTFSYTPATQSKFSDIISTTTYKAATNNPQGSGTKSRYGWIKIFSYSVTGGSGSYPCFYASSNGVNGSGATRTRLSYGGTAQENNSTIVKGGTYNK